VADNPRIDDLRRRLDKDPAARLFAQLAEELRKEGELAEAIRVARAGLAHHPSYPSARMTLGRALLDTGDLRAARVEFETVLRGAPDNILASRFLGECLEGLGDLGSALLQYRATLRLAPGDRNVEGMIRTLEERLSTPWARRAPASSPTPAATPVEPSRTPQPAATPADPADLGATLPPARATAFPSAPAKGDKPGTPSSPPLPVEESPLVLEEGFELDAPFAPPSEGWTTTLPARSPTEREGRAMLSPEPEAPVRAEPPAPSVPARVEPATPEASTPSEAPALSSSTLAELYYKQGFPEKAMEVYRELIQREPENERAQVRLRAITDLTRESDEVAEGNDSRAAKRQAIEQTITRLEGLLAAIREGAR
jgi:tetratricopeptide (TPR) repeat protein